MVCGRDIGQQVACILSLMILRSVNASRSDFADAKGSYSLGSVEPGVFCHLFFLSTASLSHLGVAGTDPDW